MGLYMQDDLAKYAGILAARGPIIFLYPVADIKDTTAYGVQEIRKAAIMAKIKNAIFFSVFIALAAAVDNLPHTVLALMRICWTTLYSL